MDITYDKKEHKFLVQLEDGSCFLASYTGLTQLLKKMAGISGESMGRAPSAEELEEFWENSVPWEE